MNNVEITELKEACKNCNVKSIFVFGSFIRDDFNENSDIDFVVDFNETDPFRYTDYYFEFKENLERIFNREIDLIEERGIKNSYFKTELEQTKVLLYAQN